MKSIFTTVIVQPVLLNVIIIARGVLFDFVLLAVPLLYSFHGKTQSILVEFQQHHAQFTVKPVFLPPERIFGRGESSSVCPEV